MAVRVVTDAHDIRIYIAQVVTVEMFTQSISYTGLGLHLHDVNLFSQIYVLIE